MRLCFMFDIRDNLALKFGECHGTTYINAETPAAASDTRAPFSSVANMHDGSGPPARRDTANANGRCRRMTGQGAPSRVKELLDLGVCSAFENVKSKQRHLVYPFSDFEDLAWCRDLRWHGS